MNGTKPWWLSRTIWVGLATALIAILSGLGIIPPGVDAGIVEEAVIAILGVLTVVFRAQAKTEIAPVLPPAPTE